MTRLRFLGVAVRNTTGDQDTATGVFGVDGPDVCPCPYGPPGHTEDQCPPDTTPRSGTAACTTDRWTCPHCGVTVLRRDTQTHEQWLAYLRSLQATHGRRCTPDRSAA